MSPRVPKEESMGVKPLTLDDILTSSGKFKKRPIDYPPPQATIAHAEDLLVRLNRLVMYWERPITISSGYRPAAINDRINGASKSSHHIICAAADLVDKDGKLAAFCMNDLPMLEHLGLWMEHPESTKCWVHLQIFPPRSGNRVFRP